MRIALGANHIGMKSFGASAPLKALMKHIEFSVEGIANAPKNRF